MAQLFQSLRSPHCVTEGKSRKRGQRNWQWCVQEDLCGKCRLSELWEWHSQATGRWGPGWERGKWRIGVVLADWKWYVERRSQTFGLSSWTNMPIIYIWISIWLCDVQGCWKRWKWRGHVLLDPRSCCLCCLEPLVLLSPTGCCGSLVLLPQQCPASSSLSIPSQRFKRWAGVHWMFFTKGITCMKPKKLEIESQDLQEAHFILAHEFCGNEWQEGAYQIIYSKMFIVTW